MYSTKTNIQRIPIVLKPMFNLYLILKKKLIHGEHKYWAKYEDHLKKIAVGRI